MLGADTGYRNYRLTSIAVGEKKPLKPFRSHLLLPPPTMASPSLLPLPGSSNGIQSTLNDAASCGMLPNLENNQCKKRRICLVGESLLPKLNGVDYYMKPCLSDLAAREIVDPGYCSRVLDFTVGRFGYGCVKFSGRTDVRGLDLDRIVKFRRHEVVVYEDESGKPAVGEGLNKAAEVTLGLKVRLLDLNEGTVDNVVDKLRGSMERQGAHFILFDKEKCEWKFSVFHFSRFGLLEDDEEDIMMDDDMEVQEPAEMNGSDILDMDEGTPVEVESTGPMLYHSLPAHLGLDPAKMKEMRRLMFPTEEEGGFEGYNGPSREKPSNGKEHPRLPLHNSTQRMSRRSDAPTVRKTPLALLEYNPGSFDSNSPGTILMAQQNKGLPLKAIRGEGFKLELRHKTPLTGNHSRNIVDAGLFMGRSFRVGWGPNGVLVHSGTLSRSNGYQRILSSTIHMEKVSIDRVVRDENNKARKELVDFSFDSPLNLHKEINHSLEEVEVGPFKLNLQKLVLNRLMLSDICRSYIDIVERQRQVSGLPSSLQLVLEHQVMTWELIKVLFNEKENGVQSKSMGADNEEDVMQDMKDSSLEVDQEALPLIRRAEFSHWLGQSVIHLVQGDVSSLDESSYLEQIFFLLTGRQLDAAVEMAASKGDVRLACLLSQAGGSPVNRADVKRQLHLWRVNGLDFNFIENERIRLYELLAGKIHDALHDIKIDWRRFLGLLMWYQLEPQTPLTITFQTYQHLLDNDKAPYPIPVYIEEGTVQEEMSSTGEHFDLSYYLMLLHANGGGEFQFLKKMFSAFASTNDPLDYHMIWHQRAVLEAVGVFNSNDLQILDMGLVSQLLCTGQCHWAIYVVLHMPRRDDYPYLHATVIREILFQYCETWSSDDSQHIFIKNLGIPTEWLHEAMAVYYNYLGDLSKALEHYLECGNWHKAHSIFITSVAHQLFLSGNDSEIWRLSTLMEEHKSEIENWDMGAGIYISFYSIRNSWGLDGNSMSELETLERKNSTCRDFLDHLNHSLSDLGDRLPMDAKVAYSKMAEEVSKLLLSDISEASTREAQLSCFDTVFSAPIPQDHRSNHLQDAVYLFTCSYLSGTAA